MSVTLTQIKQALKIDYNTDDQEILRIRDAAVAFVEEYTGVSLSPQKYTQYIDEWNKTFLVHAPLVQINSVKYYNSSNALTTMSDYFLIRKDDPSIYINFSDKPGKALNTEIEINYTAGYAAVPASIQQLIIALTGLWYNNPEGVSPISLQVVPLAAQMIMDEIKIKGTLS